MVFERTEKDSGCPYFKAVQKTISEVSKRKSTHACLSIYFIKNWYATNP